jgi:hypothetical protein
VAEGVVEDISHEGLRMLLREEGLSFQRVKTWKASADPGYEEKKARVEHLYAIADREVTPEAGEPEVIYCVDEFGPLNLQPRSGRQWVAVSGKSKEPGRAPRPRMRATYTRTAGVQGQAAFAAVLGSLGRLGTGRTAGPPAYVHNAQPGITAGRAVGGLTCTLRGPEPPPQVMTAGAQLMVWSSQSKAAVQNTMGAMPSQCPAAPSAWVKRRNCFGQVR